MFTPHATSHLSGWEARASYTRRSIAQLLLFLLAFSLLAGTVLAEDIFTRNTTLLVALDRRAQTSLDGDWHYIPDPYNSVLYDSRGQVRDTGYARNEKPRNVGIPIEYDFSKSPTIKVPGDWNTQVPELFRYEDTLWYEKDLPYSIKPGIRTFLHVGAANYRSVVWINGQRVCQHEGGFTPFDCEATKALQNGMNSLVIAVDAQRRSDGVPSIYTDWYNYGGITRYVSLVELPETFIDDFDLHLKSGTANTIDGSVHVTGAATDTEVRIEIPELKLASAVHCNADGTARVHLTAADLKLWSPQHPKLYNVRIESGHDVLSDEIGFRTIEVKEDRILLNGAPIFLRGISVHAEAPLRTGRVATDQDVATLFDWVRELGADFVRLAHYPHDARMTRTADRLGILVWSEIPDWQNIAFSNPRTLEEAKQQLQEMIRRDRNRASVILWSVANETQQSPERTTFLKSVVEETRRLDPTRLVTAAFLPPRTENGLRNFNDPLAAVLDVIGINEYIGWYEGSPEDAEKTRWAISFRKPIIVSEFGAEAKAGFHGGSKIRWTEESQAEIYQHQIRMLTNFPQLRGTSPWILMDFRSPTRNLPGLQDGFNRKGIVSEHGEKKLAFQILKEAYKDPGLFHPQ